MLGQDFIVWPGNLERKVRRVLLQPDWVGLPEHDNLFYFLSWGRGTLPICSSLPTLSHQLGNICLPVFNSKPWYDKLYIKLYFILPTCMIIGLINQLQNAEQLSENACHWFDVTIDVHIMTNPQHHTEVLKDILSKLQAVPLPSKKRKGPKFGNLGPLLDEVM